VTPTSSVAGAQRTVTAVPEAVAVTSVGVVGGSVSAWHCGTVMVTVEPAWETLPAASRALTYRPQVAPGTTVSSTDVAVPGTEVMSCPSW